MTKRVISIEIDEGRLERYSDTFLATSWHVAQANPARHGDAAAGDLVERIGREIIRRWLRNVSPELWRHQGRHHYWQQLGRFAKYVPGGQAGTPEWEEGTWVPRDRQDAPEMTGGAS